MKPHDAATLKPELPLELQRPRLRADLEFTHRRRGDAVEVIMCDPATGRYFRAGELEAALFTLLDGESSLEEITSRLTATFPDLDPEDVPPFVAELGQLGFLVGSRSVHRRIPLYQHLLYAKIRVANPDRLFARLAPWIGWLYRPAGWLGVAALLLAAAWVAFESQDELRHQIFGAQPTPALWLGLWLGALFIGTVHEFGHGLTCKYFGGRTGGIGLLFIYGMPCFYCDVSGAWMLSEKRQRLWVGAAGLYYQFIAGALALLAWRMVEPGTVLSGAFLVMITSCGAIALFNLHPFLKLDGYYLLSDAFEIPNLRQRAFGELWARLGRFWFGTPRSGQNESREESDPEARRTRRICLIYAVSTALFLVWLLPLIVIGFARFFIGRWGGTGALLLILLLLAQFGAPIAAAGAALGRRLVRWKEISMSGRIRLLLAGGLLFLAVPAVLQSPWALHLAVPCKLEATTRAAVRARTDGRIVELLPREGARVRRGQVIGYLATYERAQRREEREAQLRTLRMEIAALEARLPMVEADASKTAATATMGAQEAQTRLAEEAELLPSRRAEARARVEAAHAAVETARARVVEAEAAVEAQRSIATRTRGDVERARRGEDPPALAAARERWKRLVVEQELAGRDRRRVLALLAEGVIAVRQLDHARAQHEAATRRVQEARQEMTAIEKTLREAADDAEAELAKRQAALEAAHTAEAAAGADEVVARDALRQVEATSRPARLETARLRVASEEQSLRAARATRHELRARAAEIAAKRQAAGQLAAQLAVLKDQIRRSALTAPCTGVVTTPRAEERVGTRVAEGATVLEVEEPGILSVRIFVNEKDFGEVRRSQPVAFRMHAFPDRLYHGRITELAPRAVRGGSAAYPTNLVEVRARVENRDGALRPGMSGIARIDCGRRTLGDVLLRRVARYVRTEVWSWF